MCSVVITVLQQDSIAIDVDYEVRQGCYSMSLQLARLVLSLLYHVVVVVVVVVVSHLT